MELSTMSYRAGTLRPHEELALWRENLGAVFDVHADEEAFHMSIDAYNLGAIVLGPIRTTRQRYQRSRLMVARTGLDHYLIQHYRTGSYRGVNGGRDVEVRPGDIAILDLAHEVESEASEASMFNLMLPRALLDEALGGDAELGGLVLRGETSMGGLLGDHLRALAARLPYVTAAEASGVVEGTAALIAACVRPTAPALERAQPEISNIGLRRMKRHIASHLDSPDLSPELMADHFRVSRTSLYRAFAAHGGVARYIREIRLERCARALADPAERLRSVNEIAAEHGFPCPSHFSRLFRNTFGHTPSDVRRAGPADPAEAPPPSSAMLDAWIRSLGAG
jgi:AraC-like DNA-binding protein